ncbi:hypothetical protein BVX98_00595 [bacterium F11]|nr:hypothetical protein BVX98_00595 [bacterium F11]
MNPLLGEIEREILPLFSEGQVELVDLTYRKEHGGWVLCLYVDKPGGVTLDDCQYWSEKVGTLLDSKDIIPNSYSLEVSSPGLNRILRKPIDFQRFQGERIAIKLYAPVNGRKQFGGILVGADENIIRLKLEGEGEEVVELPRQMVSKANLDPIIEV